MASNVFDRMKRLLCVSLGLLALVVALVFWSRNKSSVAENEDAPLAQSTNSITLRSKKVPGTQSSAEHSLAQRRLMDADTRLQLLEKLGAVPEAADDMDWKLAEQTSWWGKPLDSVAFWKDRVIWMGNAEIWEANRRGRAFPPLPNNAAPLPTDGAADRSVSYGVEGPSRAYRLRAGESGFWSEFTMANPQPPERLALEQRSLAESIFQLQKASDTSGYPEKIPERIERRKKRAQELGFPVEGTSEEALFWSYVFAKREEYEKAREAAGNNPAGTYPDKIIAKAGVDAKYITEPLTSEQLAAANVWKISYLQRLRQENKDESYIQAYLKAWDLNEVDVFGVPK
jgi:hypothetical protein